MKINDVVLYVKSMLGHPVIDIYTQDDMIEMNVREAFSLISPHCFTETLITKTVNKSIDLSKEEVVDVLEVIPATNTIINNIPFTQSSFGRTPFYKDVAIRNFTESELLWYFNRPTLYITNYSFTNNVTIKCFVKQNPEDTIDERIIAWIKRYSLALTKEIEGRIRSKFKAQNIPIELDGETLLNEATQEKEQCISELNERSYGSIIIKR